MWTLSRTPAHLLSLLLGLTCYASTAYAQQTKVTLWGRVIDPAGAVLLGAKVTLANASGVEKATTTDREGHYSFVGLTPGEYTLLASAEGFAPYKGEVLLKERRQPFDIEMRIDLPAQEVTVGDEDSLSTESDNNADSLVLRGSLLEALPEAPEELERALQTLAGPSGGGGIRVDGFSGSPVPPKSAIREIRINQNAFSAENDRPGFGGIDIVTKPGSGRLSGQAMFGFGDESLNSRHPFAPARAPYQMRFYNFSIGGPFVAKRSSFFINFWRRDRDEVAVINAVVLDSLLNVKPFRQVMLSPHRLQNISSRLDFQLNSKHTLTIRYAQDRGTYQNAGVGELSLPSRAYDITNGSHTLQVAETAVLSQRVLNETRFQYVRSAMRREDNNPTPAVQVLDAFTGGGSQIGMSFSTTKQWEFQNYTTLARANHTVKVGVRVRGAQVSEMWRGDSRGTFVFGGGVAPPLDANNQPIFDVEGRPILSTITSLERYRRTLLFQRQGLSPSAIVALGGGATQLLVSGGRPQMSVGQWDVGAFVQDEWRLRPDLTIGAGLRYETQSNIHHLTDFAPRLYFAWSPGGSGKHAPKTVFRGGAGVFYDRIGTPLIMQTRRFNGVNQQQYLVTEPACLNFPNVPSLETLSALAAPQNTWQVADNLRPPLSMQMSFSVERSLSGATKLTVGYRSIRALHVLRARNVNAPLPSSVTQAAANLLRPLEEVGNIFRYESNAISNQKYLSVNFSSRFHQSFSIFAWYNLGKAESDSDGAGTFPANTYDLHAEYGRAAADVRHQLTLGSSFQVPWQMSLNVYANANSGRPFNIILGRDVNGDTLFTERPAFATDLSKPNVVLTPFGAFDMNPIPGQRAIPRNYGTGPAYFSVNLQLGKQFKFGEMRAMKGDGKSGNTAKEKRYRLNFSLQIENLLNRTNLAAPVGSLSSPFFGHSISTTGTAGSISAGNRRIETQVTFGF
jgi:hypothetical protein